MARRKFPKWMLSAVLDEDTGEVMEYRNLMKNPKYSPIYRNYYAKWIVWLVHGKSGMVEGTNTMLLIEKTAVPADRWGDVMYGKIVVDYRPKNTDPYWTRLTVGGYKVQLSSRLRYTHSGSDHSEASSR